MGDNTGAYGEAAWCDDDDDFAGGDGRGGFDERLLSLANPSVGDRVSSASMVTARDDPDGASGRKVAMFSYGSNMNVAQAVQRVGSIDVRYAACLRSFRLTFNKAVYPRAQSSSTQAKVGYATIEPAPRLLPEDQDNGCVHPFDPTVPVVWGIVYLLTEDQIVEMDRFEGVPSGHYERHMMAVDTFIHGLDTHPATTHAHIYVAHPDMVRTGLRPSKSYLTHLMGGRGLLPPRYVSWLESLETVNPSAQPGFAGV